MPNYFIIGGDQQEYGPVTADELKQWIGEGRLNGQSLARAEEEMDWRPLASFPEFAATLNPASLPKEQSAADFSPEALLAQGYDLDIGRCISQAWEAYKNNFWTYFGAFWLAMVAVIVGGAFLGGLLGGIGAILAPEAMKHPAGRAVLDFIVSVTVPVLSGPIMAGLYLFYLKNLRGQAASLGEIFSLFQRNFKAAYLGQLLISVIAFLCMLTFNFKCNGVILPLLDQMKTATPEQVQSIMHQITAEFMSLVPVLLLSAVPLTYFIVSLVFTLPLVADKPLSFGSAVSLGWKLVHRHWFQIFGLTVLGGLISMVGILGCVVGVVVTLPLGTLILVQGYEAIVNAAKK